MKKIKTYESFTESDGRFLTDEAEIRRFLSYLEIENYDIHPDGTVDVLSSVLFRSKIQDKKLPIKFGVVHGDVYVLTDFESLEGFPQSCDSLYVNFSPISLTSLDGCPKNVMGDFDIVSTPITSLIGGPEFVGGYFDCSSTQITSFEGSPKEVVGWFDCSNTGITDLTGCPQKIEGELITWDNDLTSFMGGPKECGGISICTRNSTLRDPRGLENIQFDWDSFDRVITFGNGREPILELLGLFSYFPPQTESVPPEQFHFYFYKIWVQLDDGKRNIVIRRLIDSLDYNWIRGDTGSPYINLFRLKEALSEFDIPLMSKRLKFYKYYDDEGREVDCYGVPVS